MSTPHLVPLDADHPGFRDSAYRARRDAIARAALDHRAGDPPPRVAYTPEEDALWASIRATLDPLHARWACRALREAARDLDLGRDRVPQLADVDGRLSGATGFRLEPVAGLIRAEEFLERLADGVFLSTQYIRHTSRPHYTPEPDVVHELVGHAASLGHPVFADWSRDFGRAARRALAAGDTARLRELERLYWFTLEYGVVEEDGQPRAVGAGLLSSVGEIRRLDGGVDLRPFDPAEAAATPYDPTHYQPRLFVAAGLDAMVRASRDWMERQRTPA